MQDFTGVPAIVDLAAMRDAMEALGGDPATINPLRARRAGHRPLGHRRRVGAARRASSATPSSSSTRNRERYQFLRWAQDAFDDVPGLAARPRHLPPGQPRVPGPRRVRRRRRAGLPRHAGRHRLAHADGQRARRARLGRRRHRGRGGDARPAASRCCCPRSSASSSSASCPRASTATDLVLTVAELLRQHGVVGKFVEFYGDGRGRVPLENRATIGNMSPEYGSTARSSRSTTRRCATCAFTGRPTEQVALVEAYAKEQGLWHDPARRAGLRRDARARPVDGRAQPRRPGPAPGPRAARRERQGEFDAALARSAGDAVGAEPHRSARRAARRGVGRVVPGQRPAGVARGRATAPARPAPTGERRSTAAACSTAKPSPGRRSATARASTLDHGHVVIAAITSCTNTSNPSVMIAAGLLAKKAVERGLTVQAVGEDLARARLARRHRLLRARPG